MSQTDYKAEVLKVYPDAECRISRLGGAFMVFKHFRDTVPISKSYLSTTDAWQSAYTHIQNRKKENK